MVEEVAAGDFESERGADSLSDLCGALEAASAERSAERAGALACEVAALLPRVCHALVHEIGAV